MRVSHRITILVLIGLCAWLPLACTTMSVASSATSAPEAATTYPPATTTPEIVTIPPAPTMPAPITIPDVPTDIPMPTIVLPTVTPSISPVPPTTSTLADPTYKEMSDFIWSDPIDANPNISDYAARLQEDADQKGIRCAYVVVSTQFSDGSERDYSINLFDTTDKGPTYISCTDWGYAGRDNVQSFDVIAVGQKFVPRSFYPDPSFNGWFFGAGEYPIITNVTTTWTIG